MDTTSDAADARPTTVAFVNCFNGSTFGRAIYLTQDEERRLDTTPCIELAVSIVDNILRRGALQTVIRRESCIRTA
jgi:hypothetical protein